MRKHVLALTGAFALIALLTTQAYAAEVTIRGRLGRTVEAGGWLIVTSSDKYLVLNPQGFQSEAWFRENAEVEATGDVKRDAVTIYQEGVPFEARLMRAAAGSQTATGGAAGNRSLTRVLVTGDSIVQAQPDTAILVIAVVTQSKTALGAQTANATQSDAVVRAVKAAAGAGAEVKTSGYNLQPQRVYRENQPPTISGYEARNTVTVTMNDLPKVGAVIDAAAQAGANNVDSVSFTLRKDRPARDQALVEATREAMSKAQVMAQALGGRVVRIVEVEEEGTIRRPPPIPYADVAMARMKEQAVSTPIEVGTLDVTSRVQLAAEIEIGQ